MNTISNSSNNVVPELVNNHMIISSCLRNEIVNTLNQLNQDSLGKKFLLDLVKYNKEAVIKVVETKLSSCFSPCGQKLNSISINLNESYLVNFEDDKGEWYADKMSISRAFLHELIHLFHYVVYGKPQFDNRYKNNHTEWDNDEEKDTIEGSPNSKWDAYNENTLSRALGDNRKRISHIGLKPSKLKSYEICLIQGCDGDMSREDFKGLKKAKVASAYLDFAFCKEPTKDMFAYINKMATHKIKALLILLQNVEEKKKQKIICTITKYAQESCCQSEDKKVSKFMECLYDKLASAAQSSLLNKAVDM